MKQCEFVFIALTTFIYLLYFAQCQYTTIWNDNFDTNSGWTCGNGNFGSCSNSTCVSDWKANVCFVPWSDTQPYCENSPCAMICAIGKVYKSRWLQKSTNIAAYSALELQFSVGTWNNEKNQAKCQIYYSYDAGAFQNPWERSGNGTAYNDQVQVLGSTEYATNVTIKLQIYGNSDTCDSACYFDNVVLNGILRTDAPTVMPTTLNPTTSNPTTSALPPKSPSKYPSKFPTQFPTTTPTNIPTEFPSKFPTQIPTISPTKTPTLEPTISPTKYPTKTPTLVINSDPTLVINSEPSHSPTLSTESITLLSTNSITLLSHDHSTSPLSIPTIVTAVVLIIVFLFMCGFCMWKKRLSNQFKYSKDFTQPLLVETAGNILHNQHNIEHNYTHTYTPNPMKQNSKSNDNDIVNSINKFDETSTGIFTSTSRDDNITNGGEIELLDYVNKTKTLEQIQNDPHSDEMNEYVGDNNEQTEIGNAIGERGDEKKDNENSNVQDLVKNVHIYEEKDVVESVVKNEAESSECVVCMDKATQYACIPCGHHCLCETCKDMIDNKCPICMTTCTVFKIFK